ncbi:protein Wiz-like isoform X1 [Sebastes umbrosus]|uniref:protein Wiz-like isoform X1 n=2 Tax=Sebastes umbrosus TaxID=72105 RepID=UPI0018A00E20|nr:protein Wiz-like isoform X1 [Sebastes umbrosus]
MENKEPKASKRCKGGHYCIAPGCSNEFYRVKKQGKIVHFHSLPLKRQVVLRRWLDALKRENPPVWRGARVCSEHFVNEDYVEERVFDSEALVVRRTNKLKPEAAPSVFDFSSYKVGCTGGPTQSTSKEVALRRQKRAQRHAHLAEQREDPQRVNFDIPQKKPKTSAAAMDSKANPQPVICEVCGTYFETRRGLSSHARLHLRQLGVTLSESSGAPIELLYQLIQEKGNSLPDFKADSSIPGPAPLKKTSQQESRTSSAPEDMSDSFKAGSRVMTTPPKTGHRESPARPKESPASLFPSSPSGLRLAGSRTSEGSSSSSERQTTTKPMWAPLETDAPITLASDTKKEVHVCQLCGCWYGTRKGLSGHARAHLRQIGIPERDIKGSPIDLLYQIMEEEDLKPISSEQTKVLSSASPPGSSSKRPSGRSSPPVSPPIKRPKSSADFTCILCGERFENRKGLAIHARAHLRQIGVVDPLGKSSAIDTVQELVDSGMLEAMHPHKTNRTTSSSAAPCPSTSLSPSPAKYTRSPVNKAPKAKKGFRLAVDPLHRKPKPEPEEIEVSVEPKESSTDSNSPTQKSPAASKPLNAASSTDVQSPPTVLCDYCGQLFETRKALSCHARAHLRQLGLAWSIRTSPIDLLREVMMRGEEGKKVSVLAGSSGKATWTPQGSRRSLDSLQSGEPATNPSSTPLDYSMKEKSSSGRSGASHTDASCELCGFEFENRKALASHARAHLRQLGIIEWKVDGANSPIELLSELIRKDPARVAAITRRYRMGDLYIKKAQRGAASPSLSTDADFVPGGSLRPSVGRSVSAGSSRHSHSHTRSVAAHSEHGLRSPRGVHPPKRVVPGGEENQDTNSQQASRSGSIPAMLPKPPLTPLVKLVGKIYSLKCRFCEEVFHGPLSVQERWITHLQKHILSLGYKGKASPPAAPVAAPALVHPVAV